ncbi:hypothetical protein PROFUN_11786 [Planoprotostelium fungivorum]|uniref:Brix domain-containing protein n=1 Tax=Planoprotostelium fungivorum TaxID=1890364 RepID=A0A2P6N8N0_9EUKA|nr:hypothetical protein PROFUN_11786 [Planoprotostelium fungivorum]
MPGGHAHKKGNKKKEVTAGATEEEKKAPQAFIFKVGVVPKSVRMLRNDLRGMMKPYNAYKLKEKKTNKLKDFLSVAGPLGVTHFCILTATEFGTYLRLCKIPRGPTLTFNITSYTTCKDIRVNINSRASPSQDWMFPPLVILSNFPQDTEQTKLASIMIQNMFPAINVHKTDLSECKRVVIFYYNRESNTIELRHYFITTSIVGINKNLKQLVKNRIPNIRNFDDISEYVLGDWAGADSEAEDGPENTVEIKNQISRARSQSDQNAIRLTELGPRMTLELVKVEDGFCEGKVLYHSTVTKTAEEVAELDRKAAEKKKLKKQRQKEQEKNVKRKRGTEEEDKSDEEKEDDDDDEDKPKKEKYNPLYRRKKGQNKGEDKEGGKEKSKRPIKKSKK